MEERLRAAMQIDHLRMRRIAQRLIYFDRSDALPEKTREALSKEIKARLNAPDDLLPWRTIADARQGLAKLQSEGVGAVSLCL